MNIEDIDKIMTAVAQAAVISDQSKDKKYLEVESSEWREQLLNLARYRLAQKIKKARS
jgi:hypothetical protein